MPISYVDHPFRRYLISPWQRFLLILSYDGTEFHGWQSQSHQRTVQETIETSLSHIYGFPIKITGSGRTDAGVHAIKQYAHADLNSKLDEITLVKALNSNLPHDIRIKYAIKVSADFHARFSAIKRAYIYRFSDKPDVFKRHFTAMILRKRLNLQSMQNVLPYFIGKHDFTSFSKFNPAIKSKICNITSLDLENIDNDYVLRIQADRFLHNMVRRIVGTIMNISHFDIDADIIRELFANKDTTNKLIYTAPARGLFLEDVFYDYELNAQLR